MSKRRRMAVGQQRLFGAPKDVPIDTGKPLGVRNLANLRPSWKPGIVAQGDHYGRTKLSEEVYVSANDREFLECFEYDEIFDGEEIWNRYFKRMKSEIGPKTFHLWIGRLIDNGLISIVTIR